MLYNKNDGKVRTYAGFKVEGLPPFLTFFFPYVLEAILATLRLRGRDFVSALATKARGSGDLSALRFKPPDPRRSVRGTEEDRGLDIVGGDVIVDLRSFGSALATNAFCVGDLSALRFKSPDPRRFVR